jgi:[ribosomal protein S5]-alanine N-acetyltransferase
MYQEFTPEIVRFMVPAVPTSIEQTRDFIRASQKGADELREVVFMILNRQTGEYPGNCGLHVRGKPRRPELGIWLKRASHGNGYGREAICGLIDWARDRFDLEGFLYPVDRRNIPSRRIPESLGAQVCGEAIVHGQGGQVLDELIYLIK